MSYDVCVHVPTGSTRNAEVFWLNYTSNTSWMWGECLGLPEKPLLDDQGQQRLGYGVGGVKVPLTTWGLGLLDGAPCSEAAGVLADAVERMTAKADDYHKREPENGWGTYEGALAFLAAVAQAAHDHPLGIIRVSS